MKVAICDDSLVLANQVDTLLHNYDMKRFDVDVFTNPLRLLASLADNYYDFFILDIEMPEMSGVVLAGQIRDFGNANPIIFVTSYKEYMEDVFALHTFDYLIKPLTQEKMNQSLKRLTNYLGLQSRRFTFTFNRTSHSLDLTEIRYFEKNRHTVLIHTIDQIYETSMTTADVLAKLDHRFVQVHQSFIVNVNAVKHLKNQSLILNDETIIPISRKYQRQAKIAIMAALREMMS